MPCPCRVVLTVFARPRCCQVANLVCSPDSFFKEEDNWFGFIAVSRDDDGQKEVRRASVAPALS